MKKGILNRQSENSSRKILHENRPRAVMYTWRRLYLTVALIAAVVVNFVDAILLQRKLNFFTGGFLSIYHLKGFSDIVIFVITSFIADLGITIPITALTLWLCSKVRLNMKASMVAAFAAAIGPIVVADFMSYQILDYAGNVFDLALAFEIAGRSLSEVFAIASAHLFIPLSLLLSSLFVLFLVIWGANGYCQMPLQQSPGFVRLGLEGVAIFLTALFVTSISVVNSETLYNGLRRKPSSRVFSIIGQTLTDFDRDGYGLLSRPRDPVPFNSHIFPYATEIPGNGIDENGVAGDLPSNAVTNLDSPRFTLWKSHPAVILIVLESFRADLIGRTYEKKQITPVLNGLSHEGISAQLSFAHIGYTAPSRYHLFSGGLMPGSNRITLIDDFKANGYEVAYFSAEDESFGGELFNIGFNRADVSYDARVEPHRRYTTFSSAGSIALPYNVIVEKVSKFLANRHSDRPLFLYVNLQDAHFPYHHRGIRPLLNQGALSRSEISPDRADKLWATYVNTAANVDAAVGEMLDAAKHYLKNHKPGIIVTADHGESLYDDSFLGHGFALNDIQTRVPLIIVNLPMVVEQPFGKSQMRHALNLALEQAGENSSPVLRENPMAQIFQYMGDVRSPSQIAFRGINGRVIYDFRTDRVQISNWWKHPSELTNEEFSAFKKLVNFWESVVIESRAVKSEEKTDK